LPSFKNLDELQKFLEKNLDKFADGHVKGFGLIVLPPKRHNKVPSLYNLKVSPIPVTEISCPFFW